MLKHVEHVDYSHKSPYMDPVWVSHGVQLCMSMYSANGRCVHGGKPFQPIETVFRCCVHPSGLVTV